MALRLLDTNIVSYLFNGHSLAARYRPHLLGFTPAVCFMTVAELYEGAERARWAARRPAGILAAHVRRRAVRHGPVPRVGGDPGRPSAPADRGRGRLDRRHGSDPGRGPGHAQPGRLCRDSRPDHRHRSPLTHPRPVAAV